MRKVSNALQRQLDLNEGKNLLHTQVEQLLEMDETFLAALEEQVSDPNGPISADRLERIAADAAASLVSKIYARNQYIQIDKRAQDSLKRIYIESWQNLVETKEIESTIRNHHYPRIRAFLEQTYPHSLAVGLQKATQLGRVPCGEYSAGLQTRIFRFQRETIKEPILDIGCGAKGNLVRFLRSQRLEAYGLDRTIDDKTDFLIEADWFDYDYGLCKWGTVFSNLSLANHLMYAQRYDRGKVPLYLNVFSDVLDSLSVGGSFTFAPAVPQMEEHVDLGRYMTNRWELPPVARVMEIRRIAL